MTADGLILSSDRFFTMLPRYLKNWLSFLRSAAIEILPQPPSTSASRSGAHSGLSDDNLVEGRVAPNRLTASDGVNRSVRSALGTPSQRLNPVAMRRAPGHACSHYRSTECADSVQTTRSKSQIRAGRPSMVQRRS